MERYPDWFIPCPSINPQRKDWEAELAKCVAQGARVVKVHPPTQAVDPGEPRFREFYRRKNDNLKAIEGYKHALEIDPNNAGVWNNLGVALIRAGEKANDEALIKEGATALKKVEELRKNQ